PVPRPAYLYAGTCDAPGAIQWPLNSLVSPGGEPGGAEDRDRTEYSFTGNVPLGIDLMLTGEYMIAVHESGENPDRVLVCGNIGGVADSAGTLVVGLRQASEVEAAGVAVLSPSPANPTMTLISVFVSGPGLGDEVGTIGIPPVATADPGVPDTDSPPVDTQPEPVNPDPGDDDDDDDDGDDDDGDDD
ncbi:MAG: hypothetical protein M3Y37_10720, partial [Chloroflexota bacterium]|nr:hypothetical protein [Chloroflexota bacterium]